MKNPTNHPTLVKLVKDVIARIPQVKSYIANRQDPTQVNIHKLTLNQCIDIKVVSSFGDELKIYLGKTKIVDLYLDNYGIYLREDLSPLGIRTMRHIRKHAEIIEIEEYDEFDHYAQMYI